MLYLLPFMEQQALYNEISSLCDTAKTKNDSAYLPWPGDGTRDVTLADGGTKQNPFSTKLGFLICPSDANSGTYPSELGGATGPCCYVANAGDATTDDGMDQGRGPFLIGDWNNKDPNRKITTNFSAVTDGLSNTVFFSEQGIGAFNTLNDNPKSGISGTQTPDAGTHCSACAPIECLGGRNADGTIVAPNPDVVKGQRWGDGRAVYTSFSTVLPPNSMSCVRKGVNWYTTAVLNGASSYHPGGVNVCMGDGACRFISDTVNCGDLEKLPGGIGDWGHAERYFGPTVYGVWGAVGSAAGKDQANLP